MSRARATDPTPATAEDAQIVTLKEPAIELGSLIVFRAATGPDRAAIVTSLAPTGSVNAVVFGWSHDDSEAGLKVGLVRKGDHWVVA